MPAMSHGSEALSSVVEFERELILSQMAQSTKANASGLSGCACVTRMRSGEKGEVWGKRRSARRLNE